MRGASRPAPRRPVRLLLGFQAEPPAFVFGPVGGSNPAGWFWPNPALKRTRVAHWASWPAFSAAPLSSGVGRVQERAGARRAGRSAGKLWAAVVPPGLAGLPFGLSQNWGLSRVQVFWSAGAVVWLPRPAAFPFAPRGFGLGSGPQCAGLFQPRRGSSRAWRKPSGPPSPRPAFARVSGGAARFRFWSGRGFQPRRLVLAQPGAQADAGCALGFVAGIFRRAA